MRNLVTENDITRQLPTSIAAMIRSSISFMENKLLLHLENYVEKDLVAIILNLLESPFLSMVVEHHPLATSLDCPANQNEFQGEDF